MKAFAPTVLALALLLISQRSEGFSYRMIDDPALIDDADLIVTGTIIGIDPARSGANQTVYRLLVRKTLDGAVVGKEILVKLPGGLPDREVFWLVPGIPHLAEGERVLIAGEWQNDGTLMPNQLSLGLFQERQAQGTRVYTRYLSDSNEVGDGGDWHALRDASSFESWLTSRAQGHHRPSDYLRPNLALDTDAKFTLMQFTVGATTRAARWSSFDTNTTVNWTAKADGQANMGSVNSFTILQDALNAWTNDASSRILLGYSGTNASNDTHCDDLSSDGNRVLWNDPLNTISGSFNCSSGGVLATAGPCVSSATSTVGGTTYFTAFEARLTVQDNAGCFFSGDNGRAGAEVLTHELGHTLGFGHSCGDAESPSCGSNATLDAATMRAFAHDDGRGAALGVDDIAAAAVVYPAPAGAGTFTIANASITEGNSGTQTLNFVVTRTGGSGSGSVTATTANGTATTADGDYVSKTQVLNFAAAGTQNFAVTINGDTRDEDNETFTVTLSAPSAGFSLGSPSSATGTITDNDNPPTVGINSPAAVAEGSTITFTVSLSAASGKAISVNHTTASGGGASGATEGSDFSDATGTLNFAAGETSKTFNVSTTNDALDEADTETFTATLSAPTNATLGTSSGTGSINDNDPLPSVSIADTAVTEGDNLQFTVTLTPVSGRTVTVPFSTADGTATVAGNDYLQTSSSIQIAAGNGSGTIIVNTLQDSVDEPNETLTVNLGTPTNATVGDGSATGTILDDDITAGVVSIADASLTEGNAASANMSFTVSIPAPLAQATSVTYGVVPLDATPVLDYTAVTGTATIGAGNTSTTINVPVIGDTLDEWDEQFLVNIVATASSTIGDGQAVGTIIDNDSGGDPVFRNGFE